MTTATTPTLDALYAALGRTPHDANLRLVLADALQELGHPFDVLSGGYRALAAGDRRILRLDAREGASWYRLGAFEYAGDAQECLPDDWFYLLEGGACLLNGKQVDDGDETLTKWRDYPTRRMAEDAAAEAFSRLPPRRRAVLLAGKK